MLFISDYPNKETIKDGMLQRVKAIDKYFEGEERTYLSISLRKNIRKQKVIISPNCILIKYNFIAHFFLIVKHYRINRIIYLHSIYNGIYLIPFLLSNFNSKKKVVLDAHGSVPEEQKMMSNHVKAFIYNIVERIILQRAKWIIVVTHRMKNHLIKKHQLNSRNNFLIHAILPKNILKENIGMKTLPTDSVIIVYSGNTQVWQNIDLMMQIIQKNDYANFQYYLLTGDVEGMRLAATKYNLINRPNIIIKTVAPNELKNYYSIASYGFVLRDNNVVNNVACPTKLIEYMKYGIIPIVKSEEIGDFKNLGFEYIKHTIFNKNLQSGKSLINKRIVQQIINSNSGINFKEVIVN